MSWLTTSRWDNTSSGKRPRRSSRPLIASATGRDKSHDEYHRSEDYPSLLDRVSRLAKYRQRTSDCAWFVCRSVSRLVDAGRRLRSQKHELPETHPCRLLGGRQRQPFS